MFHLPLLDGPENCWMLACCQEGQTVVAKVDLENAVCQGVSNIFRPWLVFPWTASTARSQAALTPADSL